MRRGSVRSLIALLVGLAVAAGCSTPPQKEIDEARKAMDAAGAAQASDYAPDPWAKAQDAQAQLDEELQAQQNRFILGRSYTQAEVLAVETKAAAETAAAEAENGKIKARDEAFALIERAKALQSEVGELLKHAPRGKGAEVDLVAMTADAGATSGSLAEAESAVSNGSYIEAKVKAEAVIQTLEKLKSDIKAAQQAASGHRPT